MKINLNQKPLSSLKGTFRYIEFNFKFISQKYLHSEEETKELDGNFIYFIRHPKFSPM